MMLELVTKKALSAEKYHDMIVGSIKNIKRYLSYDEVNK